MKIFFRTDSSLEIGSGHVMRCLTLARALQKHGAECHFVCRAHFGHLASLIQKHGFQVYLLEIDTSQTVLSNSNSNRSPYSHWLGANWETDAAQTIGVMADSNPDWLVIDHYAIDKNWEARLRSRCGKILVIDDIANRVHDCDLLLDQNLVANLNARYRSLVPDICNCFLGPHFALLQPEYPELHQRTLPRLGPVKRALVYFGNADKQNLTKLAISTLLTIFHDKITIDVILNSQMPHFTEIQGLAEKHVNLIVHESVPSLATLMLAADFAIGAAGTTSWERCCLGLPAIVITLSDNQRGIAAELHRQGFINWLGDQEQVSETSLGRAIIQLVSQVDKLEKWSAHCLSLADGNGTQRVASAILLNAKTPLKARPAELRDEAILLDWANDPGVRKNAFSPNLIHASTHHEWLCNKFRNPQKCQIYIVETEKDLPVGQVRFEREQEKWEVHYSLASFARGRGIGVAFLEAAIQEFERSYGEVSLFGRVKKNNIASQKVLEEIGFTRDFCTELSGECIVYQGSSRPA